MSLGNPIAWTDSAVTGKPLGGGLCLYVNKNWCNTVVVRETLCTPDIELLYVLPMTLLFTKRVPAAVCYTCLYSPEG